MQRNFEDTTWWDPYVEDITDEDTYLRRKFRQDVTDKTTGLSQKEIPARLAQIVAAGKAVGEPWRITKAKCFAAQVLEESIDVSPLDWFPAIAVWDRHSRPMGAILWQRAAEVDDKYFPGLRGEIDKMRQWSAAIFRPSTPSPRAGRRCRAWQGRS